jgi:type I restriction enzyme M protein
MTSRLDDVFAAMQQRFSTAEHLSVDEPFTSENPAGVGAPLRTLTLKVNGELLALLGVTDPALAPQKPAFLSYVARRARARKSAHVILSNERETFLARTPRREDEPLEILKQYPTVLTLLPNATGPLEPPEQNALNELLDSVAADLVALQRDGRLGMVLPDSDFFVARLTRAVDILKPAVKSALQTKLGIDRQFSQALADWAVPQGIPADLNSPDFSEAVVRQAIYRLLGKIIFYQSLRRAIPLLPEMNLAGLDTGVVMSRLEQCFAEAHKIDYHAVFRDDIVDRLPFPAAASAELRGLVGDLNTRDFSNLPQDVVGAVFERLIPPEDRHALGQFFTRESLVDLTIAFCVRDPDDRVLDPTVGTGTFAIRSYNCLETRFAVHDHSRLLSQIWGIDIAPFPAELATINLFRQRVDDPGNFPRIINEDFFQITPGGSYRFPPLKAGALPTSMVDEQIPQFDAILGNFPYIGADRIEKTIKGYRAFIQRRLAEEWLRTYPEGFTFPNKADQKSLEGALKANLDVQPLLDKAVPIISSFADFYVFLFWHAAAFLKPGGRMGIVTSNAWLDVGYGYGLQRFLLDHFKIVAILESRCEPWFEQAAVNTVVTIVERCESAAERDANPARFVQIKKTLAELIPQDMRLEALTRWNGLYGLVQRVEAAYEASNKPEQPETVKDNDFRIRVVNQGALRQQVEEAGQTAKWGPLLRAPQVYFDLVKRAGDKFALLREVAPPSRGGTTRINEFFYLDTATAKKWEIDREYCLPLIKSPRDAASIKINLSDLELSVFVCRKSKAELRAAHQLGTLRYIEWGEQQEYPTGVQRGMKWPDGPWVRDRQPGWYALPESETKPAHVFMSMAYGERHIVSYSPTPLIADNRLYFLDPQGVPHLIIAAIMNSSFVSLFFELVGRITLGDGALELKVEDVRDYLLVPDLRRSDKRTKQEIEQAFKSILTRPIGTVFDEVQQPDRQALDRAMLKALGLSPSHWLPRIYEGLTTLVRERSQLGQMRGQSRRGRTQKAAGRVADDVLHDIVPDGPKRFPDDFFAPAARTGKFREIPLPDSVLRHKGHWMGREDLATDDGHTLQVANRFEMRYVLFAQASGQKVARLPAATVEVTRTVTAYTQYLRELRQRLTEAYFTRTLDQASAARFVADAWKKLGLPETDE